MTDTCNKITALSTFWGCEKDEIEQSSYDKNLFEVGSQEFLVCTDTEADEECARYIADSLWAFNPDFLEGETGIPKEVFEALQPQYENANETIERLITDMEGFVQSAIGADGRGHFLASYDGNECEQDGFYVYRVN